MSVKHWGQGAEAALLLHCTLAQGTAWAGVARHLRCRLTMTAPDLLAHGQGPAHDPAQDFHDQATAEAARHLPPAPCHLIGHSFGATLALRLALDHPTRVKSLTLIEPVLFCATQGPGRAAHDTQIAGVPIALARGDAAGAARIFLGLWGAERFDDMAPSLQSYIIDRIWIPEACDPALTHDRARILPRVPHLRTPTLLLRGEHTQPVIAEIMDSLAAGLPAATAQTIPGAAHMAPLTHPAATARAIAMFLNPV